MRLTNKRFLQRLLLSTALTSVSLLFSEPAQARDVFEINTVAKSADFNGGNIIDTKIYRMTAGSGAGTISSIAGFDGEELYGDYSKSFVNGIYHLTGGDFAIGADNANEPPVFDFSAGGIIWDLSGYAAITDQQVIRGTVGGNEITWRSARVLGSLSIGNGIFTGAVNIKKGLGWNYITTRVVEDGSTYHTYSFLALGNIEIYGGRFYFSQASDIQNTAGDVKIGGSTSLCVGCNYNIAENTYTPLSAAFVSAEDTGIVTTVKGENVRITGGNYYIDDRSTLILSGSGSLDYSSGTSAFTIAGGGTLQLSIPEDKSFSISSPVDWETGTLKQMSGTLFINSDVTVDTYVMNSSNAALNISGRMSVTNNVNFNGSLSGSGELVLSDKANGSFGILNNFGTISVKEGKVSFLRAVSEEGYTLNSLIGADGEGDQIGLIYIGSKQYIKTIELNKAALVLNEELTVNTLDFGSGQIIFTANSNASLTFLDNTTIYNTAQIITTGDKTVHYEKSGYATQEEVEHAMPGMLTIKEGKTLTFADAEGSVDPFVSNALTVKVENSANAVFDATSTTIGTLALTTGTAEVKPGASLQLANVTVGNGSRQAGLLTVDADSTMTVSTLLDAKKGATISVNGILNVKKLKTDGSQALWATLTGDGTVRVTGAETEFKGRIVGLANLVVDGGSANVTFNGQTGREDTIGTMTVKNGGTAVLTDGTLTLNSLSLNGGTIDLSGENAILALRQDPTTDGGISGDGNSISGAGTLELLNDTGITFGGENGAVGYLGGLKIGTGTATISSDLVLGSVSFRSSQGGSLRILPGQTLTLSDNTDPEDPVYVCTRGDHCRIVTQAGNTISGTGTLNLIDGDNSSFGGQVTLGGINFAGNATTKRMTFGYTGSSSVQNFRVAAGTQIYVNNGILTVGSGFKGLASDDLVQTNVSGTGTLFLQGDASITNGAGQSLYTLKIGAGRVTTTDGTFRHVVFNTAENGRFSIAGTGATVTQDITVGAGNTLDGTNLILDGSNTTGTFNSDLTGLTNLTLQNGATVNIGSNTQVGATAEGLVLNNGTVIIASGKTLTANNATIGTNASSVIKGEGTLNLGGANQTVKSSLNQLNTLQIHGNTTIEKRAVITHVVLSDAAVADFTQSSSVGRADIAAGTTMNFSGGSMETASVSGTLNLTDDTAISTVSFGGNGEVNILDGKTLNVSSGISVGENQVLSGSGTLFLSGTAVGTFAMDTNFAGTVKIGSGRANINTNAEIGSVLFASGKGGVLNIENGKMLTVGEIHTAGTNGITGVGALKLTGVGLTSVFGAPIDSLGQLIVTNSSEAELHNTINITQLIFDNGGGSVHIANGTMTVNAILQNDGAHIGTVYGDTGVLIAGNGTVKLSTGNRRLGSATIGSGTLDFVGNSFIGSLNYSSAEGTVNIREDVTVKVASDFSGIGKLTGDATASLQLLGAAGATFNKANNYQGSISAGTGKLSFLTDMNFKDLELNGTNVNFKREAVMQNLTMSTGTVEFNQPATVSNNMTISSKGSVLFKDTSTIGSLNVTAGSVSFQKNAEISNGTMGANGSLHLDVNTLTVNTGNFNFNDNSGLSLRIARTATDEDGNVNATGYGKVIMSGGGTMNIGANVNLDVTIDYGLNTAENGSVFKLVEGNKTGGFTFSNNRYSLTEVACEAGVGICYRLKKDSTAGQYVQNESGDNNQVDTANAFLDGELFTEGTKAFTVAEHLDALSQKGSSSQFLNALTALAPDVSNGMSRQPVILQSKISNTLSGRLNGLGTQMGSNSGTYRNLQKMYGRSGGSPYKTRYMRSSDYYRNAGYYDDNMPAVKEKPAYRRHVDSSRQGEFDAPVDSNKRWAKRKSTQTNPNEFGLWAQTFYNKAGYSSTSKPDGFSGDTTGFAIGGDVQLFDVFALGIGYATMSSSVDSLQRSTDIDGTSVFLYGMYKPSDWFVSSVLNMASLKYDEKKNISGVTVGDKYNGSSVGGSLMIGRNLKSWTPAIGVRYVSSKRKAHKDEIGQDINAISSSVTTFVAEGRTEAEFAKTDAYSWHRELSAAITYDMSSSKESASVNLPNGSSYSVKGDDFSAMGVELGASLSWIYGDHVDVTAGYSLEWRSDYLAHTLTATYRYSF